MVRQSHPIKEPISAIGEVLFFYHPVAYKVHVHLPSVFSVLTVFVLTVVLSIYCAAYSCSSTSFISVNQTFQKAVSAKAVDVLGIQGANINFHWYWYLYNRYILCKKENKY